MIISWAISMAAVFGAIDASRYPREAFSFIGKLPKLAWIGMLVLSALLVLWLPLSIFGMAGIVATSVYFAGIRPKVRELAGLN